MIKWTDQSIAISIVTSNSSKIFDTLDTLIRTIGDHPRIHLLIHDNASTKEYREKLETYLAYSFITIHFDQENRGFGYGHNQNLLSNPSRYGVIFNPDILVEEQTIVDLVNILKEHPECAMLAPKILNDDGTTQHLIRQKLDVFDYFLRFQPFPKLREVFRKRLAAFECRDLSESENTYVRMISGSFMVVDLQKFQTIQGFDERYFMYFEDNDLCLRFEEQGEKLLYVPNFSVIHLYGKGAHRNPKLFRVFMQSMKRFFDTWGWQWF